jgi:BirA family biotin operon repressor/biotin-[acetyl-CoA-carboxylase] ligase
MAVARQLALKTPPADHGTAVVARLQTAGRGRQGRIWQSPRDAGLWLTCLLRPIRPTWAYPQLALVAGAAVWAGLTDLLPSTVDLRLKWPNDLLVGQRKLAGILLEAEQLDGPDPFVLVGIGINLLSRTELPDLPPEVAARHLGCADLLPLAPALQQPFLADLTAAVLCRLAEQVALWESTELQSALGVWRQADALRGQHVRITTAGGTVEGQACGLADDGQLQVRTADGITCFLSGEVSLTAAS